MSNTDPNFPEGEGVDQEVDTTANAVATDDPDFIGVSEEYKNYADPTLMPRAAEEGPEKELEERAKKYAEDMKKPVGHMGFSTDNIPHPSKAKQPASAHIDQNRKAMEKQVR